MKKARLIILVLCLCSAHLLADTITVAVTGDVMMGTTYPKMQLPVDSGKHLFADVRQVMQSADITLGNLEGTLCDEGHCTKGKGKYSYAFRTPTGFAPRLTEAGYDYMSMANNHANDFGLEGIISSERALRGQGIAFSGIAGRKEWAVVERAGIRFGICAFGHNRYTLKHRNMAHVKQILDTLRATSDIIIVSFHGGGEGIEYSHLPEGPESYIGEDRGSLREFAHFCIDNGADIVYGHGPHVVRCIEVYKGHFIAYSLGNFCTPYGVSLESVKGYAPVVVVQVNEQGEFLGGKIHSFIQQRGRGPMLDAANKVARHMRQLSQTDVPYSEAYIDYDGQIIRHTVKIPSPTLFLQ
ncbi:MAG: CapA family protein [Paludibacteraceae bacterium]|nr:CapA family protein [Paludibacteraceae bacterium]